MQFVSMGASPGAAVDPGEAFSSPLVAWLEASGDLWKAPQTLLPGEFRRAFSEELLEAHLDQFADEWLFEERSEGSPARSAGAPCQVVEQVGNREPGDAGTEAIQSRLSADHGRDVPRADPSPGDHGGPWLGGPTLFGGISRRERAGRDRRRAQAFGGPTYTAKSPEHCQAGAWSLGLVHKGTGEWTVRRFRCRSWRCPKCAPSVNRRDAERIEEALGPVPLDQVLFLTFTFDRKRYAEPGDAWRACREAWKRLRDALAYRYGKGAGRARRKATICYVQTWEQHKDGWPHVHALVWSPEIAADVRRRGSYQRTIGGEPRAIWRWGSQVLREAAVAAGFGPILDAQFPRRERGALAGYLVKIAAELTGSTKKDQAPVNAPKGFRRIRATPKFLEPARRSTGDYVGELLFAPFDAVLDELERGAESIHQAAEIVKGQIEQWLRPPSARNADRCSTREGSQLTEAATTG